MLGENQEKRLYIFISIRLPILAFLSADADISVKIFVISKTAMLYRPLPIYIGISVYRCMNEHLVVRFLSLVIDHNPGYKS